MPEGPSLLLIIMSQMQATIQRHKGLMCCFELGNSFRNNTTLVVLELSRESVKRGSVKPGKRRNRDRDNYVGGGLHFNCASILQ